MAAIGRIRFPISDESFNPPHFPRNKTPFGFLATNKSIIVAALGEPIPKLIILKPSELVLEDIGRFSPCTSELNLSAN